MITSTFRKCRRFARSPLIGLALGAAALYAPLTDARPSTYQNAQEEVFAIGDLHGDFNAMVKILRGAKLINQYNQWIGGSRTLVQVGDQLDRGDTEKEILDLFEDLIKQAEDVGGQVLVLNGNHETMNVELDFRYITSGGFKQFAHYYTGQNDSTINQFSSSQRGRAVAFRPGGPYAIKLAEHNSIVQIGKTVFVHGGITSSHVDYGLDRMNTEISSWMHGHRSRPSAVGGSGPLWNRDYGGDVSNADCNVLSNTLARLNASRLVIAHTRQRSINNACDGMVWRIDVGMSSYYGGKLQALKITNDDLIQIVDASGKISDTGFGGTGGSCLAPGAPDNLKHVSISNSAYTLEWSKQSKAEKYIVQRWNGSQWLDRYQSTTNSITITDETETKSYVRVLAVSECDKRSGASGWVTIELGNTCSAPAIPDVLSASDITANSYTLNWPATNAERYTVQRWDEPAQAWQDVGSTTATNYALSGEPGPTAYSRVIAISACGSKAKASDWVTVKLNEPDGSGDTCPSGYSAYNGTLSASGTAKVIASGYYSTDATATHAMSNIGATVELRLYKWDGAEWQLKRSSNSELSYNGSAGYYYPYLSGPANQAYSICLLQP